MTGYVCRYTTRTKRPQCNTALSVKHGYEAAGRNFVLLWCQQPLPSSVLDLEADKIEQPHDKTNKTTCAQRRLRLAWASAHPGQSSLPFCWFCHEVAQLWNNSNVEMVCYVKRMTKNPSHCYLRLHVYVGEWERLLTSTASLNNRYDRVFKILMQIRWWRKLGWNRLLCMQISVSLRKFNLQ